MRCKEKWVIRLGDQTESTLQVRVALTYTYHTCLRPGRSRMGAKREASFIDDMSFHSIFLLTLKKKISFNELAFISY